MEKPAVAVRVHFGSFELDRRSGELLKAGSRLRLQEHPLRLLEALLDRSGDIVTREELQRRLWPDDTFVDFDNGLNSAINRLRAALGDRADKPRFIETVGGRGYRFIAPVRCLTSRRPRRLPHQYRRQPRRYVSRCFRSGSSSLMPIPSFLSSACPMRLPHRCPALSRSPCALTGGRALRRRRADLSAIATGLDVTLVLGGTVLRIGERVRVSTQLVEVPRGTLLWTSTADVVLTDMFQVSDGLVRRIVESLGDAIDGPRLARARRDVPGSGRAYELYLRANGLGQYPALGPRLETCILSASAPIPSTRRRGHGLDGSIV